MRAMYHSPRPSWWLTGLGSLTLLLAPAWAQPTRWPSGQLAPSGYSGAINTPTADVLPWGGASAALTNSNPEKQRSLSEGYFGSINAGIGLLPGLELVGRLAFEGDIQCNLFDRTHCAGGQRDLSLSGKYQLPLELPWNTRLALGFTDYGGAATNYRQVYGVASSTWGPVDLSLGYGRPRAAQALLDGAFGSAALRVTEQLQSLLERDGRHWRAGLQFRQPLGSNMQLQLGASRLLSNASDQQRWQWTAALNVLLGQPVAPMPDALLRSPPPQEPLWPPPAAPRQEAAAPTAAPATPAPLAAPARATPSAAEPAATAAAAPPLTAQHLAELLTEQGFAQVQVRYWPDDGQRPALWEVQAEPRRWRQSQLDGMAAALALWYRHANLAADDGLALTLSYQQVPVLELQTSTRCLSAWFDGAGMCGSRQGQQFSAPLLRQPGQLLALSAERGAPAQSASAGDALAWAPQFELGPSLRTAVGTELGLLDYSLAAELGAEVHLTRGLFWQGTFQVPLAHSDDYAEGGLLAAQRHRKASFDLAMLSYLRPLPWGAAAQLNAGYINRNYVGGQIDALWMEPEGRWRASATLGRYQHTDLKTTQTPALAELRYSLQPGVWDVQATAGRFLGGDKGLRLASNHWFGDTQVQLFLQSTQSRQTGAQDARLHLLGFRISLPLGPQQAWGRTATLRASDRWNWGLQTKVGGTDNALTVGAGDIPRPRHGLYSDVTDHDRNGAQSLRNRLGVLRSKTLAFLK